VDLHVVLLCEHPLGALFLVIDGVKNHRHWRGAPTDHARARGSTRLVPTELASSIPARAYRALPAWGIPMIRTGEKTVIRPTSCVDR
jgi:hypothetical protein